MNLLYCCDNKMQNGVLLSILSFMKNISQPLKVYILTAHIQTKHNEYQPFSDQAINFLQQVIHRQNSQSSVQKFDITRLFQAQLPQANMATRFTPNCMLRLYADLIPELPERLLYLDADVLCHLDCSKFYEQDLTEIEVVGVLDQYGKWFFHNQLQAFDYLNSGVLLLNLQQIKRNHLFARCRRQCRYRPMFMPDQAALNHFSRQKRIAEQKYNEQHQLHSDTVLQHFTTQIHLSPYLHLQTIKPWQIEQVQQVLKIHDYDDIFATYQQLAQSSPFTSYCPHT